MTQDHLGAALTRTIRTARNGERDLFGALDPAVRERPIREGDWTPKDFQAHLSAWKGRHADRLERLRAGVPAPPGQDGAEEDEVNAELRATRLDWAWDAIVAEAEAVSERLISEIEAAGSAAFRASDRLVDLTFGNGLIHTLSHIRWLVEAGVPLDPERVAAYEEEALRVIGDEAIPQRSRAAETYNLACHHALMGSLDRARTLLRDAFRMDPALLAFAVTDADLVEIRSELDGLAAG